MFKYYCSIYDDLKIVYFETPKCASTSILRCFKPHTPYEKEIVINSQPSIELYGFGRQPPVFPCNKIPEIIHSYFKFTVIRNPWDRLVSAYYEFCKRFNPFPRRQHVTFEEFVLYFLRHIHNVHWWPQLSFFPQNNCDLIIRFEHLVKDWKIMQHRFKQRRLRHYNGRQNRQPYQEYYINPEVRKIVEEYYREDIEELGYTFD
jgi:hypothetical protein